MSGSGSGCRGTHPRDWLHQVAVAGPRPTRTGRSRLGAQVREAGEVGGSSMRSTSSALFGFEQTVGIDLSLERRHEGRSGRLGRLARVVGRVESVCTDPAAKGPTGPLCLVHSVMLPVLPVPGPTDPSGAHGPAGSAERPLDRRAVLALPLHLLLGRAWGRVKQADRERADPTPSWAEWQRYVVRKPVRVAPYG